MEGKVKERAKDGVKEKKGDQGSKNPENIGEVKVTLIEEEEEEAEEK